MISSALGTSIIGVVVLLGGLIFFHELGHYLIAKLFKVKVEVFSLGFGKKLIRKRVGETEYCLSLIPFGGYVKLMGDDPYKGVPAEEAARAFSTQRLYKRFAIVAAGPMFNLILAFVLYVAVFWLGQPLPGSRVGSVVVASPAWEAGIRPRDLITEVDGKKVQTWPEIEEALKFKQGQPSQLLVKRGDTEIRIPYQVAMVRARNPYGEEEEVGGLKGAIPYPWAPKVGVSDPNSLAFKAGLRTGDLIAKIGSREIAVYEEINDALLANWKDGEPLAISVKRPRADKKDESTDMNFSVVLPKAPVAGKLSLFGAGETLGLYPSEVFVKRVEKDSPAAKGGLEAGDRIVKVGENSVYNFDSIVEKVQDQGPRAEAVKFTLERGGKTQVLNLSPVETELKDPISQKPFKRYMVGFEPTLAYSDAEVIRVKYHEPVALISHAGFETWIITKRTMVSLYKLVTRKIDVKHLGGPIMIARVAGQSLDAGIVPFLQMMSVISINLFLLNLFPIPILDGGHLLFFTIEAIKGKPVSIRTMEIATQIGMVFILMLVGLTIFNDITRYIH